MSKGIKIPGINFQGGAGGEGGNIASEIQQAELGVINDDSSKIIDAFISDKGSKSGCNASGSALRFNAGSNSMTYTRNRIAHELKSGCSGLIPMDVQALKPKTKFTAGVIKFNGDVTNMFTNGNTVIICREVSSDGQNVYQPVYTAENIVQKFTISAVPTFASDETTLTLTIPAGIDPNMGYTTDNDAIAYLRIFPFNFSFLADSADTPSYEVLDIDSISDYDGKIGLIGENYVADSGGISGTCLRSDTVFSQNKQYGIRRFLENQGGTDYIIFEYSVDKGKSWNYFGGNKASSQISQANDTPNEHSGNFQAMSRSQIAIANNGKFFVTAPVSGGTYWEIHGRYGDLSSSNTLNLSAAPTTGNSTKKVAGIVFAHSSVSAYGQVAICDDGSFVAVTVKQASGYLNIATYTGSGATWLGWTADTTSVNASALHALEITGSGTSHRIHHVVESSATGALYAWYVDESAPTIISGSTQITAIDTAIIDSVVTSNYLILLLSASNGSVLFYKYKSLATNTWYASGTTYYTLEDFATTDLYQGWSSTSINNFCKSYHQKIVVDPQDDKHVFFVQEVEDAGSGRKPLLAEVKDITNYVGISTGNTTATSYDPFRNITGRSWVAQTFKALDTKIETVVFRMHQKGTLAQGKNLWAEIWTSTTPTAAGGLPSTLVTGAVSQMIDPKSLSKLEQTDCQLVYFNFPRSISYTNGNYYAVVIKGDWTVDGSNYVSVKMNGSSVYADGAWCIYDGAIWSATAYDLYFRICNHRLIDVGNALHSTVAPANDALYNFESSIALVSGLSNETNIQFITRRNYQCGAVANWPLNGHPYRRIITINSGAECTMTPLVQAAYSKFDPNLVFNVANGLPECYQKSLTDGSNNGNPYWHRSGLATALQATSVPTFTTDSDFITTMNPTGACASFSASNYDEYGDANINTSAWALSDRDFCIEAEIKVSNTGAYKNIICSRVAGYSGFMLQISNTGYLTFHAYNGSATQYSTMANAVVPMQYHKTRVTRKNGIIKLWKSTVAPYTSWTEYGYSINTADNITIASTSGTYWTISAYPESLGTQGFNDKIGYVKAVIFTKNTMNEANPFAFDGWASQPAIVDLQNHGHLFSGEKVTGESSATIANNYDDPILGNGQQTALIDSMTLLARVKKAQFDNQGKNLNFRVTGARTSDRDQSNIKAVHITYTK